MATPKRTEITIETQRVTVIRTRRTGDYVFCHRCSELSLPLSIAEVAAVTNLTAIELASRLDDGHFHRIEHGGRTLTICGTSVANSREDGCEDRVS